MSVPADARSTIGPAQGRVLLRTYREGVAKSVGHDLIIELTHWSAEVAAGGGPDTAGGPAGNVTGLTAVLDMTSMKVLEGTGGVKPLSDRDKREIAATARKQIKADANPEARFTSTSLSPAPDGGGTVAGTLALAGSERPFTLTVESLGNGRYRGTGTVVQTEFGIKPYSGLFGTLKLRNAVDFEIDVDLSGLGR